MEWGRGWGGLGLNLLCVCMSVFLLCLFVCIVSVLVLCLCVCVCLYLYYVCVCIMYYICFRIMYFVFVSCLWSCVCVSVYREYGRSLRSNTSCIVQLFEYYQNYSLIWALLYPSLRFRDPSCCDVKHSTLGDLIVVCVIFCFFPSKASILVGTTETYR